MNHFDLIVVGWNALAEHFFIHAVKRLKCVPLIICGSRQFGDCERKSLVEKLSIIDQKLSLDLLLDISIDLDASLNKLLNNREKIGYSFDSPFIFKKRHIDFFHGRLINEHGACLPDGRGGGGFSWRILENDHQGSVIFHLVDEGIDTGPLIYRSDFTFPEVCRCPSDYDYYQLQKNKEAVNDFLLHTTEPSFWHNLNPINQEDRISLYFPRLSTQKQAFIDWNWNADDIISFINAFSYPYEGAKTDSSRGHFVHILRASLHEYNERHHPYKTGLIFHKSDYYYICCRNQTLKVHTSDMFIPSNKALILKPGDRLFTSQVLLDEGKSLRPSYNAQGIANA